MDPHNERGLRCHHCADNGNCCEQANGKCCYWCVPDGASKVTFEIWSWWWILSLAVLAVIADPSQVDPEEVTLLKQLAHVRDAGTQFVLVVHGPVPALHRGGGMGCQELCKRT